MHFSTGLAILLLGMLGFINAKSGVCPNWPARPRQCSQRAEMNSTCSADSDCPGKQRCCQDACENHCADPVPFKVEEVCPTLPTAEECPAEPNHSCLSDKQCGKGRKCCYELCDNECVVFENVNVPTGEKPVIAGKPDVSKNKLTHGNITITCRAQGVSSLRISWYRDWEPLDNHVTRKSRDEKKIISQLNIPNVRCKDAGLYRCVAKTDQNHAIKEYTIKLFNRIYATAC